MPRREGAGPEGLRRLRGTKPARGVRQLQEAVRRLVYRRVQLLFAAPEAVVVYGTFRPNFHHFDRFELDLRGHIHMRGAAFSCLRLKWADMVLI